MISALLKDVGYVVKNVGYVVSKNAGYAVYVGATSYAFCRAVNQHNAFEKAVLVTVLVGLRNLAEKAIRWNDPSQMKRSTGFLIYSANLLTIPSALYAGRVFNFKAADYLQIVGLASIGYNIKGGLQILGEIIFPKRKAE